MSSVLDFYDEERVLALWSELRQIEYFLDKYVRSSASAAGDVEEQLYYIKKSLQATVGLHDRLTGEFWKQNKRVFPKSEA
jgi:hypothetical protein